MKTRGHMTVMRETVRGEDSPVVREDTKVERARKRYMAERQVDSD